MAVRRKRGLGRALERFSSVVTRWTGSSMAFAAASGAVIVWALTGPIFGFSNTWQLVINTATTVVTFLMVFLIQRAQNKDALAIHLKLNELVAALEGASNRLIDVEDLTEHDLDVLHRHYARLSQMAKEQGDMSRSHSIEEAERRHRRKARPLRQSQQRRAQRRQRQGASPSAHDPRS
jgi:low affinity Fe/Cu permease